MFNSERYIEMFFPNSDFIQESHHHGKQNEVWKKRMETDELHGAVSVPGVIVKLHCRVFTFGLWQPRKLDAV